MTNAPVHAVGCTLLCLASCQPLKQGRSIWEVIMPICPFLYRRSNHCGEAYSDQNLAIVQVPTVEGIGRDSALLYEAESEEVAIARDTFGSLRQYLVTLQQEVRITLFDLQKAMPMHLLSCPMSSRHSFSPPSCERCQLPKLLADGIFHQSLQDSAHETSVPTAALRQQICYHVRLHPWVAVHVTYTQHGIIMSPCTPYTFILTSHLIMADTHELIHMSIRTRY